MYKIYINDVCVLLAAESEMEPIKKNPLIWHIEYENDNALNQFIMSWESYEGKKTVCMYNKDLEVLKYLFFKSYDLHVAGGGVVFNENQEVLLIFRNGKWDLPKGHQEEGETIEETALREVQEETGLTHLTLGKPIELQPQGNITYHTYFTKKGKRVMKESHWFEMQSTQSQDFVPQTEEDIERVIWAKTAQFPYYFKNTYGNIQDVLSLYMDVEVRQ